MVAQVDPRASEPTPAAARGAASPRSRDLKCGVRWGRGALGFGPSLTRVRPLRAPMLRDNSGKEGGCCDKRSEPLNSRFKGSAPACPAFRMGSSCWPQRLRGPWPTHGVRGPFVPGGWSVVVRGGLEALRALVSLRRGDSVPVREQETLCCAPAPAPLWPPLLSGPGQLVAARARGPGARELLRVGAAGARWPHPGPILRPGLWLPCRAGPLPSALRISSWRELQTHAGVRLSVGGLHKEEGSHHLGHGPCRTGLQPLLDLSTVPTVGLAGLP